MHGQLQLIQDALILPNSLAAVVPTAANQGHPNPWAASTTQREQENHLIRCCQDWECFPSDLNAQKVLKELIFDGMDDAYLN